MSESYKICPICGASNHRNAVRCLNCGAVLTHVETAKANSPQQANKLKYDYRYGETDLYEGNLKRTGQYYLAGVIVFLALFMCGGLALLLGPRFFSSMPAIALPGIEADADTNTPRPTLDLPTVTTGPPTSSPTASATPSPTPTMTPTREPCYQDVQSGDTLYSVVARCGYNEFESIFPIVQEINGITDPALVVLGQRIEIPWPTETPDPSTLPTAEGTGEASTGSDVVVSDNESPLEATFDPLFIPTATLQPGIQFHTVIEGDSITSIIIQYSANVEALSQLNPEIEFPQCDFGQTFGGPRCAPLLSQGQQIRVPAPTPTPTLSPTPSGNETPTPMPTPTFNAPSVLSPDNRALFRRDQLITLRWLGSGTLGEGQSYRLQVEDTTAGIVYSVDTLSNSFIVPEDWQGQAIERHIYTWTVSVIDLDTPDTLYFTTEVRSFTWEGLATP